MTKKIKPSRSQLKTLALYAPSFGSSQRSTRAFDTSGTIWLTVEVTPRTDLEKDLAARYGWIAISYFIRRNGKLERTTFDPRPENLVWAYSTRQYR